MAEMLTYYVSHSQKADKFIFEVHNLMCLLFQGGRSTAYVWEEEGNLEFADENYAREIMQLFTMGLFRLNEDGTSILDSDGSTIKVYTRCEWECAPRCATTITERQAAAHQARRSSPVSPKFCSGIIQLFCGEF